MWSECDDSCILYCLVICQLSQNVGKLEVSLSEKFISQRNATGDLQKEIQRLDLKWEQLKPLLRSHWYDWFTCTLSEKSRPTKAVSGAVPFQKVHVCTIFTLKQCLLVSYILIPKVCIVHFERVRLSDSFYILIFWEYNIHSRMKLEDCLYGSLNHSLNQCQ